jgi:hypothetical protein
MQYLGAVTNEASHYNYIVIDDLRGYFLFPKQMLEAGAITSDPFNLTRLGNGLAGQAILQAMILVVLDFYNILLMDAGIALIVCVGLVWDIAGKRGLSFPWKWLLVVFFLCFPYYPTLRINASSFATGMAILLALFDLLDRDDISPKSPIKKAFIIGLLAAGACALKTTYLPPLVMILAVSYLCYLITSRFNRRSAAETLFVPAVTFAMLLPWMLALLKSSGTMLYMILGTGYDEFNYGRYIADTLVGGYSFLEKIQVIWLTFFSRDVYMTLLVAGVVALPLVKWRQRAPVQAFAFGSLTAMFIVLLKVDVTKAVSLHRYFSGIMFVALTVNLAGLMAAAQQSLEKIGPAVPGWQDRGFSRTVKRSVALLSIAIVAYLFYWQYGYAQKAWDFYRFHLNIIPEKLAAQGKFFPDDWIAKYKKAQETVPEGAKILSLDTSTAAYDFGRNTIYYMSLPGACSPPPGMPYFTGPGSIANYLLSQGVRYVAYNYRLDGGLPIRQNFHRIRPGAGYYNRIFTRAAMALDIALKQLGGARKRLYDDGSIFILDLERPATSPRSYQPPNYFQEAKILTPGWAETSGFHDNKVWTKGRGRMKGINYQPDTNDRFLVLNTFGYHPWFGDISRLGLMVAMNGRPLPLVGIKDNAYYFSIDAIAGPITEVSIDTTTFVPREQGLRFGKDDDTKTLGIDVDTIEIKATP